MPDSRVGSHAAALVPLERIERTILLLRGERVILDTDLAALYGVSTKVFNQAVRRNLERFPADFMLQLTPEEFDNLRSQSVTSSRWGGRRYRPYAFTEHGAIMAANILNAPRAVQASIMVVRAFVRLRQMVLSHAELARRLDALERKYDAQFKVVFDAIRELMEPPPALPKGRIGFLAE